MTNPSPWRLRPTLGNVLVRPQTEEQVTASGLHLVSYSHIEKETHVAEVVEVCEPYTAAASDRSIMQAGPVFPVGTLVVIGKYNGREVKIDRDKFILLRESDVLATLELRDAKD